MSISELEQELTLSALPEVIEARRKSALTLSSFRQTRIEGSLRLDRKSILVLQMPFDRGWRVLQDGQAAPVYRVDDGLLGVSLDAGEHKVELRYATPFLVHGLVVSLNSLAILAASLWQWPRFRLSA